VTVPAVLSSIVALNAVCLVVDWRHTEKKHATELSPASLVLASAGGEPAIQMAASSPEQAPSWASAALPRLLPRSMRPESERSVIAPTLRASPSLALERRSRETPAGDPSPAPAARSQSQYVEDPRGPDEMKEVQEVATAERLLQSSPSGALSLVRSGEARFATGYLREERRYVGVIALFKLGRVDEARVEAVRFLSDYPESPFGGRVRGALLRAASKG